MDGLLQIRAAFKMSLTSKVTIFFVAMAVSLIVMLVGINLYAFRSFSIASSTDHIRTAAEIVRVHLTESMINGVIDKRESFLERLMEVQGLASARVVRSPLVVQQFGEGLGRESPTDEIEKDVLSSGKPQYRVETSESGTLFRGTIPFVASTRGSPNCLQCHQVHEGSVLGAVTMTMSIESLKNQAIMTVAGIVGIVGLFSAITFFLIRRVIHPVSLTAENVELAVQRALKGDFKGQVEQRTEDEVGQIAADMNRLLSFLDSGLNRIGASIARLTNRAPGAEENLLNATIDMVDGLSRASCFKQAIEEDETKAEIHQRMSHMLNEEFGIHTFSLYEIVQNKNQMLPLFVDGEKDPACKWCDPEIMVRSEACRARRTGHMVDSVANPGICYAFKPQDEDRPYRHICMPIIQSGMVGNVLQLVSAGDNAHRLQNMIPFINVYLREAAPVLETKRLMETLRESSLSDPMTGLNNRRFLEEYVDTLVANVQRRNTSLTVMMLDLDHFKMVNDTYGHDAGDTVLKSLARVLRQSVRAADLVIRFGGEEFLILLVDTPSSMGDQVAEKIRSAVESMTVQCGATTLRKTISIGLADFPTDSDTFWQAVKFADVALYQAKETGRNRVVRFTESMWTNKKEY
jgi:diguanylate cyclase (GGDEF)-like protein